MNLKIKVAEMATRLRLKIVVWLPTLKKVASFFAPGLTKLGEILVISGAASIGLKGAEGKFSFMNINLKEIDVWLAVAVIAAGLMVWALAVFLRERKRCDKNPKDE